MKKLLTVVFAMLLSGSLAFAQAAGSSTDTTAKPATKSAAKAKKGSKKAHKGAKKKKAAAEPAAQPSK